MSFIFVPVLCFIGWMDSYLTDSNKLVGFCTVMLRKRLMIGPFFIGDWMSISSSFFELMDNEESELSQERVLYMSVLSICLAWFYDSSFSPISSSFSLSSWFFLILLTTCKWNAKIHFVCCICFLKNFFDTCIKSLFILSKSLNEKVSNSLCSRH